MSGKPKKGTTAPTGKPKLSKTKSLVMKTSAKPKISKRSGSIGSMKEKKNGKASKASSKMKPAYSLYSSESETDQPGTRGIDRCSELLYHLLDRKKGRGKLSSVSSPCYGQVCQTETPCFKSSNNFPLDDPESPDSMIATLMSGMRNTPRTRAPLIDIKTPFNHRLASSTPDPEKIITEDEQLIPEKDVDINDPLKQYTMSKRSNFETEFPVMHPAPSHAADPMDLSSLIIQNYSHSPNSAFSKKTFQKDKFASSPIVKDFSKQDDRRDSNETGYEQENARREKDVASVQRFTKRETGLNPSKTERVKQDARRENDAADFQQYMNRGSKASNSEDVGRESNITNFQCSTKREENCKTELVKEDMRRKSDVVHFEHCLDEESSVTVKSEESRRRSDIADFQCYMHRESTGFSPPPFSNGGRSDVAAVDEKEEQDRPSLAGRGQTQNRQHFHTETVRGEMMYRDNGADCETKHSDNTQTSAGDNHNNIVCENTEQNNSDELETKSPPSKDERDFCDVATTYSTDKSEDDDGSKNTGRESDCSNSSNKTNGRDVGNCEKSSHAGVADAEVAVNRNNSCQQDEPQQSASFTEQLTAERSLSESKRVTGKFQTPNLPKKHSEFKDGFRKVNRGENDHHHPSPKPGLQNHQHEPRPILGRHAGRTQTKEEKMSANSGKSAPQPCRTSIPEKKAPSPEKLDPVHIRLGEDDYAVPHRLINQCSLTPNVGISKPFPFLHDFVETPANSPVNVSAKTFHADDFKTKSAQNGRNLAGKKLESYYGKEQENVTKQPLNFLQTLLESNTMDTPMNSPNRSPVNLEAVIPTFEPDILKDFPRPSQHVAPELPQGPQHVNFLLKELEKMAKMAGSGDMLCLVQDLHEALERMTTFDLLSKVEMLLQPLRNENIQLNRRVKTLNQQLRERERLERESNSLGVNFELLNLQADNVSLNRQLREKQEAVTKFMALVDELQQEKDQVKQERQQLIVILDEKNKEKVKLREECKQESSKLERQLDLLKKQNEGNLLKLKAALQENSILEIALKQRDHEIHRLEQLVQTLKDGVEGILGSLDANCNIKGPNSVGNSFNLQRMLLILDRGSSPVKSVMSDPGHPTEVKSPAAGVKKSLLFDKVVDKKKSVSPLTKAALKKHEQHILNSATTESSQEDKKYGGLKNKQETEKSKEPVGNKKKGQPANEKANKISESRFSSSPNHGKTPADDLARGQGEQTASGANENFNASSLLFPKPEESCAKQEDNVCYSVSDYFRKYPQLGEPLVCIEETADRAETVSGKADSKPGDVVDKNRKTAALTKHGSLPDFSAAYQEELYKGTELDVSLSTINDDATSSAMSFSSTTTADDRAFREGIAALDANIAKVQLALQRTKSKFQTSE